MQNRKYYLKDNKLYFQIFKCEGTCLISNFYRFSYGYTTLNHARELLMTLHFFQK